MDDQIRAWLMRSCKFAHSKEDMTKLPAPWGVVYAGPNPDGSRKKCENCFMWIEGKDRCSIMPEDEFVGEHYVCGYHVHGTPRKARLKGVTVVDPKMSGLVPTKDGTSCDNCKRYEDGKCYAVSSKDDSNVPVKVDPKGCCARWTEK